MGKEKKKKLIEGVHFDFDVSEKFPLGPHIHYTTGAASLMDEPYLLKSKGKEVTEEEKEILDKVNKTNQGEKDPKGEDMGDEVVKSLNDKIEKLEKQLAISTAVNSVKEFKFDNEVEVAKALSVLSDNDQEIIVGVFKTLIKDKDDAISASEEALEKAVKEYKEDKEESALNKMLMNEEGHENKDSRDEVNKQNEPKTQAESYKEFLATKHNKE